MDDAAIGPLPHLIAHDGERVLLRIAGVDDQRQAGFAGRGDMGAEAALLPFPVAMVVIIIQAGLSYADDARMGCALDQLRGIDMRMLVRLMRMDADGRPDVW